ncbi:hypothetical protein [Streptomyces sp. NPDC047939]|uniref:hypothetical protein n=1 Tax=Streptomyces sp. NPDC047939 TaxID=3155381 RepID=UPI00343366FB
MVPNRPDVAEGVTIHFPEVDYVDTQPWSADVGVSTDALRELRDAIDTHLAAEATTVDKPAATESALREWLPVLRRAVETLPAKCRYHDETHPHGTWREACCDTGIPARRRALAEEALNALTKDETA